MSREESLVAVLVSAEAVLKACNWPAARGLPAVPVPGSVLAQLAGAVASVVDLESTASDAEPDYRDARGCLPWQPGMPSPEEAIRRGRDAGFCQADPECWRRADTADGTCYAHSKWATAERVRAVQAVEVPSE